MFPQHSAYRYLGGIGHAQFARCLHRSKLAKKNHTMTK